MFKRVIAAGAALALAAGLSLPAAAGPYTGLYVFGDSLSDTGNVKAVFPPALPPFAYPLGRFTNGLNYADELSRQLGLGPEATASLGGGTNFAFGGSRTAANPNLDPFLPAPGVGILQQIGTYRFLAPAADPNALYVVFGGANDIRDAVGNANGNSIATQAAQNILFGVQSLIDEGARHILVMNAPNIGRTPERIVNGAAEVAEAQGLTQLFNGVLDAGLDGLRLANGNALIRELDVYGLLEATINGAPGNGFTNTTGACLFAGPACSPDQFVFWDDIHPTSAIHEILGNAAYLAVIPVPPILAVIGIGFLGLVAARRTRTS